jgi:hypothetical protein
LRSKQHKLRLKDLKEGGFTEKDELMAAGLAPADNGPRLRPAAPES